MFALKHTFLENTDFHMKLGLKVFWILLQTRFLTLIVVSEEVKKIVRRFSLIKFCLTKWYSFQIDRCNNSFAENWDQVRKLLSKKWCVSHRHLWNWAETYAALVTLYRDAQRIRKRTCYQLGHNVSVRSTRSCVMYYCQEWWPGTYLFSVLFLSLMGAGGPWFAFIFRHSQVALVLIYSKFSKCHMGVTHLLSVYLLVSHTLVVSCIRWHMSLGISAENIV